MIQGCGSNVGKSLLVAGLIRAAKKRGLRVAPFKPQNMSNNAAITVDGGEAGRAQSFQAYAAGIDFHSDMNPVLLKPESMIGSQVILNGKKYKSLKAREYYSHKDKFIGIAINSFTNLVNDYDLVIAEGAGSLAEVNLRKADIANMGFASVLSVPVIVVADIERGGVIAQLIGTKEVLDQNDINLIEGFIINKFRGDKSLFDDGVAFIEKKTDWRSFGVMPFFDKAKLFPNHLLCQRTALCEIELSLKHGLRKKRKIEDLLNNSKIDLMAENNFFKYHFIKEIILSIIKMK